MSNSSYDGCRLLESIADGIGVNVELVNLIVCQLACIVFSWFYFYNLPPWRTPRYIRFLYPGVIGLALCYFCYGGATVHLLLNAVVCYALMHVVPVEYVHVVVLAASGGHLLSVFWMHWYAQTISFTLDIAFALMGTVQKTTLLAYALHDRTKRTKEKSEKRHQSSEMQQREAIEELPAPLEYFSYMFFFQTVISGPVCFYGDYERFVTGQNFVVDGWRYELSPVRPALKKIVLALIFLGVRLTAGQAFTLEWIATPEAFALGWLRWVPLFLLVMFIYRLPQYYMWTLADAICNLSGLGFNGTAEGEPRWDLVTNIYPMKVEMALSFKDMLDNWNCITMYWLRRVAYDRVPIGYRTLSTYLLSAVWHGFYGGCYISFLTAALVTVAARTVRRYVNHYFQATAALRLFYDVIAFMTTKFVFAYVHYPFVTLHFFPALYFYARLYFLPHLLSALAIVVLPLVLPGPPSSLRSPLRRTLSSTSPSISNRSQGGGKQDDAATNSTKNLIPIKSFKEM